MRNLLNRAVNRRAAFGLCGLIFSVLANPGWSQTIGFLPGAPSVYEVDPPAVTNISIIVTRNPATNDAQIEFRTVDGTAMAGQDYQATSGTLAFTNGETFKIITVPIISDLVAEPTETFSVVLFNPSAGVTLVNSNTIVTILDDDAQFNLSTSVYTVREDATNVAITITISPTNHDLVSVYFSTADGPMTNGAVTPLDYSGFATNIVFTNNQASFTVLVPIINDCLVESNEIFFVNLVSSSSPKSPVGGKLGTVTNATVMILDDDTAAGQIQFTFLGPTVGLENTPLGLQPFRIAVSRLCGTNGQITVDYEMFNDIDIDIPPVSYLCDGQTDAYWSGQRNDYTFANSRIFPNGLPGGTLTWATGDDNDKFIDITFINDNRVELDESILIRLVRPTGGATIGRNRRYEVIILNDDLPAGSCDPAYNTLDALNPTPGANGTVYASATYQDCTERTVIGGDFSAVNAIVRNGVARIRSDGFVDTTFDPGSGADGFVSSLLVLTNGQVLVGGGFTSMDNISRNGVARLNTDGSLDTAFDVGAGVNLGGSVLAMALQADGKLIVAGDFTTFNNVARHNIARLNTNGTLDLTFNAQTGPNDVVYAVAVQADGKVLLGGDFTLVDGLDNFKVARLQTNGVVDPDWTPISGADNTVFALKIQSDGKAVIGGAFATYDGEMRQSIARLQTNGMLDLTFNACRGMNGPVYAIALQPNDQAVIGGDFSIYNDTSRSNYARLLFNGALDTQFLDNYYNHGQPGADSFVAALSLQLDGNLIIGGGFSRIGGGSFLPTSDYSPPPQVQVRFNFARVIGTNTQPLRPSALRAEVENAPGNLEFVQPAYSIDENVFGGTLAVTVQRINGGLSGASVHYQTVDGSAKSNVDYTAVSGTVSWGDCSDGQRLIFIPILDNQMVEGNRNFFIELSQPESFGPIQTNEPALGFNCRAEVTIVDNDKNYGVLGFARPIFSVNEASNTATITVTRTNGTTGLVQVQFATSNGSAIAGGATPDYISTNGTLTFQSGQTSKSFTVPIINDTAIEPEETINLRLFPPSSGTGGATLGLTNATLLIFDNENGKGSVSFTAQDFTVNEAAGSASITLRRTSGSSGSVSVTVMTSDLPPGPGAARAGVDYGIVSNVVTFADGVTNQTVTIPITSDQLVEGPEQLSLIVTNPTGGATLGFISTATLTIQDDDAYGKLGFSTAGYYFNEETGAATIDIIRTEGQAEEVTVDFSTTAGTATDGADYVGTNVTLVFPTGVLLQSVTIPLINDGELEGNETVLLTLSNFSKAGAGPVTNAVLTIVDDEALAVPAGSVDTFFDPRPGPNQFVSTVALQPDGKLIVGGQFTAFGGVSRPRIARLEVDGSVDSTFNPGQGANGPVNAVVVQPDGKVLLGGSFTRIGNRNRGHIARLTSSGALDTSFNPGAGADNPVNAVVLQPDGKIVIGGGFATFNGITRNGVARLLANGVNDASFQPGTGANGTVSAVALQDDGKVVVGGEFTTFNSTALPYLVRLNADGSLDENFSTADAPNGSVRTIAVQADGKIVIGGSFTAVGATPRPYIARLNADGTLDLSFDPGIGPNSLVYSVAIQNNGRVLLGGEFTSVSGLIQNHITRLTSSGAVDTTIDFGSGANLFVSVVLVQPDEEIVIGGGFTMVNGIARSYIARLVGGEDIGPGVIQFTQSSYAINESFTNVTVTVARIGGSQGQIDVDVISTDISATGDVDYETVNQHLIFMPGETIKNIVIGITNDTLVESNEVFQLSLTNIMGGATLNEAAVTYVTIFNDDSAIGFSQATYGVSEKVIGTNAIITVVRSGATNTSVSVNYATTTGTATPGVDYNRASGVLTFQPGETNLTFAVPILNDLIVEGNETVGLILSNATVGGVITVPTATLIIIDDEFSPGNLTFNQSSYNAPEGQTPLVVTILRTNGVTGVATVNWTTTPGSATAGVDYSAAGGVLSFADGESVKTISIDILDDSLVEGNETFTVTLSNPTGGTTISGPSTVTVTIEDDEFGPGSLDPTFDPGQGANGYVKSVGVQSDGKVLIGGAFDMFDTNSRPHVARLRSNGRLDFSFNPGQGANALVSGVGVYPDGGVIIGGAFNSVDNITLNRVARLQTNGAVDTAFNKPSGLNSAINALVPVANNGVVVVGGFTLPTPGISRYRTDGSIDTTFDPGTSINGQVQAVFVQQNGQVLIGGGFTVVNTFFRPKVARLHPDGLLDQTFNPATNNGVVYAIAGQPDGKVIIAGSFTTVGAANRGRIARLNVNGTLDTSFNPGTGANGVINAIALQSDGRIVVGGDFTSINGTNRNRYARLNSNGSLDLVFDPGRGADGTVFSLALLPDGKVILGGDFTMVNGFLRHSVARVNGDTPAVQFVGAGITVSGEPMFTFSSQPGVAYATEATTNFLNWVILGTNVATGYTLTITDTTATGLSDRFYRVRRIGP